MLSIGGIAAYTAHYSLGYMGAVVLLASEVFRSVLVEVIWIESNIGKFVARTFKSRVLK